MSALSTWSIPAAQKMRIHYKGIAPDFVAFGPRVLERELMLQITPQMKILVAIEPVDFRNGIDGLAQLCKQTLQQDPFSGRCVCIPQSPRDCFEGAGLRRPGILALPETTLARTFHLVACNFDRSRGFLGSTSIARVAFGWKSGGNDGSAGLATGAAENLIGGRQIALAPDRQFLLHARPHGVDVLIHFAAWRLTFLFTGRQRYDDSQTAGDHRNGFRQAGLAPGSC